MNLFKKLFAIAAMQLAMTDATGGAVTPKAKKKPFCDKDYDVDSGAFSFTFGDGTAITGNLSDFNDITVKQLALHGVLQKGGDSYAGAKGDFAFGKTSLQEVLDTLKSGQWSAGREGGGFRKEELAEAIARIKGVPVDKALAAVVAASDDDRKAWRSNAKVKAVIAAIRAENAQKVAEATVDQELVVNIQ